MFSRLWSGANGIKLSITALVSGKGATFVSTLPDSSDGRISLILLSLRTWTSASFSTLNIVWYDIMTVLRSCKNCLLLKMNTHTQWQTHTLAHACAHTHKKRQRKKHMHTKKKTHIRHHHHHYPTLNPCPTTICFFKSAGRCSVPFSAKTEHFKQHKTFQTLSTRQSKELGSECVNSTQNTERTSKKKKKQSEKKEEKLDVDEIIWQIVLPSLRTAILGRLELFPPPPSFVC